MFTQSSYLCRLLINRWVLLTVLSFFSFLTIEKGHSWGDDFALYASQAIAIVNGTTHELYEANKFAMDYSDKLTGPYLYPVGTSLCLAPIIKIFGVNFYAMKMVMLLFWIGSLYVIHSFFLRRTNDKKAAAFITICFGLHPQIIIQPDTTGSDIPFLFCTFLFFMLTQKYHSENRYIFYTRLVAIIFAAYLFRSIGILLLPIVSLFQLINWRKYSIQQNILLLSFPYVLFFILMKTLSLLYKIDPGSYIQYLQLTDIPTVIQNIRYYIELFATSPFNLWELTLPYLPEFKGLSFITNCIYVLSLLLSGVSIYGIYARFKANLDLILFTSLLIGLYVVWPSKQGYRFIIPLLPIYIYFLWIGFMQLKISYSNPITRILPLLTTTVIAFSGFICMMQFAFLKNTDAIHNPNSIELYTFIKSHTQQYEILCFFKPRALRLETNRNTITQLTDEISIRQSKSNYYISYCSPEIHYTGFEPIFKNTDYTVYKINR